VSVCPHYLLVMKGIVQWNRAGRVGGSVGCRVCVTPRYVVIVIWVASCSALGGGPHHLLASLCA
jgi:hypothetical protein